MDPAVPGGMRPSEFFDAIGLTVGVRLWLARNEGDPLRDEIVQLLMRAANDEKRDRFIEPLRRAILKIKK